MIRYRKKEITAVYLGTVAVQSIYRGGQLVWQAIRSCFGSGRWIDDKPWLDHEAWKD